MKKTLLILFVLLNCCLGANAQKDPYVTLSNTPADSVQMSTLRDPKTHLVIDSKDFEVVSFKLAIPTASGTDLEIPQTGNTFNQAARDQFAKMRLKQTIALVEINIVGTDGKLRRAANLYYKIGQWDSPYLNEKKEFPIVRLEGATERTVSFQKLKEFKLVIDNCKDCSIASFNLSTPTVSGEDFTIPHEGPNLNEKGKELLDKLRARQLINISDIKVKSPDGTINVAPMQQYKIE